MTRPFSDRFASGRFASDQPVKVRFEDHAHKIPEGLFSRTVLLATAYELHLLPSLSPYGSATLDRVQANTMAEELEFLRSVVVDPLLLPHLDRWLQVALACARSPLDAAELTIDGP